MISIFPDVEAVSLAAAELFVEQAQQSLAKGRFSVALAGGDTPKRLYELLASSPLRDQVPWKIVHFFWDDERWVPSHDAQSNERMAREYLLDHIPVPDDQIHPIYRPGISIEEAVQSYEHLMRDFFADEKDLFDLTFLGLGENGHTASLFPHTPVLHEKDLWVGHIDLPEHNQSRVTLTAEALNRSVNVAFMVSGANKASILHEVLEGPYRAEELPAQLIQPWSGKLFWLADQAAAQQLTLPVTSR